MSSGGGISPRNGSAVKQCWITTPRAAGLSCLRKESVLSLFQTRRNHKSLGVQVRHPSDSSGTQEICCMELIGKAQRPHQHFTAKAGSTSLLAFVFFLLSSWVSFPHRMGIAKMKQVFCCGQWFFLREQIRAIYDSSRLQITVENGDWVTASGQVCGRKTGKHRSCLRFGKSALAFRQPSS